MGWNYVSVLAVCCLAPVFSVAQTSQDLRAKYGNPISEVFRVQPKIELAVTYSAEGQVCRFTIEPPRRQNESDPAPLMPTESVSALIDELVPPADRGEPKMSFSTSGCNRFTVSEYAAVIISRSQHNCEPAATDRDISTRITFKQRQCDRAK
jgi:hypothetical protein